MTRVYEEVEIDLDDYIEECRETLEDNGYIVYENEDEIETEIEYKLKEYVREMENNIYRYSDCRKTIKSYEEIYEDLKRIIGD